MARGPKNRKNAMNWALLNKDKDPRAAALLNGTLSYEDLSKSVAGDFGGDEYGVTPFYMEGPNGLEVGQLGKGGGLKRVQMPEGYKVAPGTEKVDLGTEWGVMDRSGNMIARYPKDVAGEASQRKIGEVQGETTANLPSSNYRMQTAIKQVDELLVHPGLEHGVGRWEGSGIGRAVMDKFSGPVADFHNRLTQLQGQAFLQSFDILRGGGQISNIEGAKAEQAYARLQTATDEKAFRVALKDLRDALKRGYAALQQKAGQAPNSATSPDGDFPQSPTTENDPLGIR